MFRLTPQQMEAFQKRAAEGFVDRMVAHLRSTLPRKTAQLADPELCALVRAGIMHAADRDLVTEIDVCQYVERMLLFGSAFESAGDEGSDG